LFPSIAHDIDWNVPYYHLDKELLAIQKNAKIGNRLADKLVKVCRKNGEEAWVVIHIEIQGAHERLFTERLFEYYYRIYDRYKVPLATLAIYPKQMIFRLGGKQANPQERTLWYVTGVSERSQQHRKFIWEGY